MPFTINFQVGQSSVTVTATEGLQAVTHTAVVTNAAGTTVFTSSYAVNANQNVSFSQAFSPGQYHFKLTGTDGSIFESDFTIPTTPATTNTVNNSGAPVNVVAPGGS